MWLMTLLKVRYNATLETWGGQVQYLLCSTGTEGGLHEGLHEEGTGTRGSGEVRGCSRRYTQSRE